MRLSRPRLTPLVLAGLMLACETDDRGMGPLPEPDYLAGRTTFIVEVVDRDIWPGKIISYRLMNGTAEPVSYRPFLCYSGWLERRVGDQWSEEPTPSYGCLAVSWGLRPQEVRHLQVGLPSGLAPGQYRIRQWTLSESGGPAIVHSAPVEVIDSYVRP